MDVCGDDPFCENRITHNTDRHTVHCSLFTVHCYPAGLQTSSHPVHKLLFFAPIFVKGLELVFAAQTALTTTALEKKLTENLMNFISKEERIQFTGFNVRGSSSS